LCARCSSREKLVDTPDAERLGWLVELGGRSLYDAPIWQWAPFTYPPFAALVFTPLALQATLWAMTIERQLRQAVDQ
jgi:hypothetical protein